MKCHKVYSMNLPLSLLSPMEKPEYNRIDQQFTSRKKKEENKYRQVIHLIAE